MAACNSTGCTCSIFSTSMAGLEVVCGVFSCIYHFLPGGTVEWLWRIGDAMALIDARHLVKFWGLDDPLAQTVTQFTCSDSLSCALLICFPFLVWNADLVPSVLQGCLLQQMSIMGRRKV